MDEILDLVDTNDQIIDQKPRSEIYTKKLSNFRVVNAFVVNDRGELWIPRRAADKRIYPLCLDVSVGGHVETGESYDEAFQRETLEEIRVDTSVVPYRLLGKLMPNNNDVSAFMQVYEIPLQMTPAYNAKDFVESYWLTPKALLERIANGEKAKSDLPKLVRHFYTST